MEYHTQWDQELKVIPHSSKVETHNLDLDPMISAT
jgi:hypothetical protein